MMWLFLFAMTFAISAPTAAVMSAQADDDPVIRRQYSPAYLPCLKRGDAARGVSVAMGACVHAELELQDRKLNAAYRLAMQKQNAAGKARLRAAERQWIKDRDTECQELATGGTIDMVDIPACLLSETIARRLVLEAMARR